MENREENNIANNTPTPKTKESMQLEKERKIDLRLNTILETEPTMKRNVKNESKKSTTRSMSTTKSNNGNNVLYDKKLKEFKENSLKLEEQIELKKDLIRQNIENQSKIDQIPQLSTNINDLNEKINFYKKQIKSSVFKQNNQHQIILSMRKEIEEILKL